jgi:hypothetical protein
MEFELTELRMVDTNGMAEITMSVLPPGHHSVDALLRAMGQIVGVTQIRAGLHPLLTGRFRKYIFHGRSIE